MSSRLFVFRKRAFIVSVLLFVAFFGVARASTLLFSAPAILFPASGIAIGILFLEGVSLWPVVYFASLAANLASGASPIFLLVMPVAHTLFAIAGSYLLRVQNVDPLFRSWRDTFVVFVVALLVSVIIPSFGTLGYFLRGALLGTSGTVIGWWPWYVATVFPFLTIAPFIMRWGAKPRFTRRFPELIELLAAFLFLVVIEYFIFFTTSATVGGVSLVYILLVPLFWIALRLRPRFITAALLVTAFIAVASLFSGPHLPPSEMFSERLFQTELFMIIIAMIFLSLSSLEEDRRVTTGLMKSQVATLENVLARISSESKAKNDFIAVLAHELRNPLAPVVSAIEFLKLKKSGNAEELETLEVMDDRMQMVKRLLDDLLDVSRISEGKVSLEHELVDMDTIIQRAAISTDHHYKERHQRLVIHTAEEQLFVKGDSARLEQIVSNLLTNASKYSDPGDEIVLSLLDAGTNVQIEIKDTGVGIERHMLEYVFEPFHQSGSGERTRKGLGIGLALVRSFAEMHGGSVRVESAGKNAGSTFIVQLPLAERAPRKAKTQTMTTMTTYQPSDTPGPRVLVVDDNDAAAWGIGKLLTLRGCKITYAYDGEQTLERAKEAGYGFDAILLDMALPDHSGAEVARMLRERGYKGTLIALTGYSLEETRAQAKDAGFDHYLVKPVGLAELSKVIPNIDRSS